MQKIISKEKLFSIIGLFLPLLTFAQSADEATISEKIDTIFQIIQAGS